MESLDNIISQIDNELLKLNEGQSHDFDFKHALTLFRDNLDHQDHNRYLRKAAKYIGVFNDLCSLGETIVFEPNEYDSNAQKIKGKKIVIRRFGGHAPIEYEKELPAKPGEFTLNERMSIAHNSKFQALNKSKLEFNPAETDQDKIDQTFEAALNSLRIRDRFDDFFEGVKGENITFEEYVKELKKSKEIIQSENEIKTEAINEAIDKEFVSDKDRSKLKQLFETNQTDPGNPINWKEGYDSLVDTVDEWSKKGLIKLAGNLNLKTFISNNFTRKGENINKGSLGNSITRMNSRQ